MDRQGYTFTEIKHLVVHPEHRGKGIAEYLVSRAITTVGTKMLFVTVREDNVSSLALFNSLGFIRSGGYEAEEHNVALLVRMSPKWEKIKPEWKLSLLNANAST